MPEWLKGADCKSTAFATLVRIQLGPKIYNIKSYIPNIFLIVKYKVNNPLIRDIKKTKRNLELLNKLLKGVKIMMINPLKLLIKKRGYLEIFSQKLFIKNY
jgi:hypothetical protein